MPTRKAMTVGMMTALALVLHLTPAEAETLSEALAAAYANNPTLEAARAGVRATDEGVSQAKGGYRPSIEATGSIARTNTEQTTSFGGFPGSQDTTLTSKNASVALVQPVFRGFKTYNSVRRAKEQVYAGRESLRQTEQQVLLDAVTAYMNVKRDESVVELRRNNVQVLTRQLEATQDRFRVGEITRTDVAQSEARLSRANADRILAEAALTASRSAYQRIVGATPGTLADPGPLPPLPESEAAALEAAQAENPQLLAARHAAKAADHEVSVATGDFLPEVNVRAQYQRGWDTSPFISDLTQKQVMAELTFPIYQAGVASSVARQARQVRSQRRLEEIDAERRVGEATRNAWEALREARSRIAATEEQVRANKIALEGVRQEAEVGARTTLDVLDAEQEYLDSQVSLVSAKRDEVVAAYGLLGAIGRLSAGGLGLPVEVYDPEKNYDRVSDQIYGWTIEDE